MIAKIHTSAGVITLKLDETKAPVTCANFKQYAESDHFSDTLFHRVIPGFMIQGGGFDENMKQKSTQENIKNEASNGLKNVLGSVAMARTPDPHSASSQFFINLSDNSFLDFTEESSQGWGYCVFGQTTDGMDVIDEIAKVVTGPHGQHQDVPIENVVIQKIEIED